MNQRDVQLDLYRGLIMIYILCVIHVAYGPVPCGEPYQSLILFEMPVIFFISGASLQISGNRKNTSEMILNRAKRVIFPYYIYVILFGFIMATVFEIANLFSNLNIDGHFTVNIRSILIPDICPYSVSYMYHLWFIMPFFIISCSFPIQRKLADRIGHVLYIALITCLFGISCLTPSSLLREVFGYNIFFMAGYLYYKRLKLRTIFYVMLATLLILTICVLYGCSFVPMQSNKFPPDFIFIMYGTSWVCFLGLVFSYVKLPDNKMVQRWNKCGYTIFLWQTLSFLILVRIVDTVIWSYLIENTHKLVGFVVMSIMVFSLTTLLSYIVVPVEKFVMNVSERCFNYGKYILTGK